MFSLFRKPTEKRAALYRLPHRILVAPRSFTRSGLWIDTEPWQVLQVGCDPESIGIAVINALDQSRQGMTHPKDWAAFARPRLTAAGVKSESKFQLGAIHVDICVISDKAMITPTNNGGSKTGFSEITESRIETTNLNPESLGFLLLKGFEECTSQPTA